MTQNTRRQFLESSSLAVAGSLATLALAPRVHAAGSDVLKVGLIGCGGRGTGAASQALKADSKRQAVGDGRRVRGPHRVEPQQPAKDRGGRRRSSTWPRSGGSSASTPTSRSSTAATSSCSRTPPQFRPLHLEAAVDAGKHVFAEKPVAVDAPGVRRVLETCEEAKAKNLSVVSGLCLRYD